MTRTFIYRGDPTDVVVDEEGNEDQVQPRRVSMDFESKRYRFEIDQPTDVPDGLGAILAGNRFFEEVVPEGAEEPDFLDD